MIKSNRKPMQLSIQWIRHLVRLLVLLFIVFVPVISWYRSHLSKGQVEHFLREGGSSTQYYMIKTIDSVMRPRLSEFPEILNPAQQNQRIQERLKNFRGNTWSAELFGISITDPLGAVESLFVGQALFSKVLAGIAIPVLATVLLGRVFCSWICPAGFLFDLTDKFRVVLSRFGFYMKSIKFWRGPKYVLLFVGIGMSTLLAVPLLGFLYPPALIAREVHSGVYNFLEGIDQKSHYFNPISLSGASFFLLAIVLVEIFMSKRLWCRYLCPGGALYGLLGYKRILRVHRNPTPCNRCADCVIACPMGLNPMQDKMGIECDNCLVCLTSCSKDALSLKLSIREKPRINLASFGTARSNEKMG